MTVVMGIGVKSLTLKASLLVIVAVIRGIMGFVPADQVLRPQAAITRHERGIVRFLSRELFTPSNNPKTQRKGARALTFSIITLTMFITFVFLLSTLFLRNISVYQCKVRPVLQWIIGLCLFIQLGIYLLAADDIIRRGVEMLLFFAVTFGVIAAFRRWGRQLKRFTSSER